MKLLFHYPVLNLGGAEKSTLRLLRALADRGHRITLVLTVGGGALESEVDPRIELICLRKRQHGARFREATGLWAKLCSLPDLMAYCGSRIVGGLRMVSFRARKYDAAAVLLQGTPTFFTRFFVRAGVRVHWIRSDLSGADGSGRLAKRLAKACRKTDRYVCVSDLCRDSLLASVPGAAQKAEVVHNILGVEQMRRLAFGSPSPYVETSERLRVLTVCRLQDKAKALLRMLRVHAALARAGYDFDWYVVGDGPDRSMLAAAIESEGLQDRFHLVGGVANPFPYYRHADMVAMLSYYEGLCGAVNEGKVMGKPVLATEVSGIREQIEHGCNGWVVANDEKAIIDGLRLLLDDDALRGRLANDHLPPALLDDEAKLDALENIFRGVAA